MLTGSSENTVESSMRPWRRRTQAPSLRSIAGIISIGKPTCSELVFLKRPDVAFDALEAFFEMGLNVENHSVVIVWRDFAGKELEDLSRLERAQIQVEALLHEALDLVIGFAFLIGRQRQDRRLEIG